MDFREVSEAYQVLSRFYQTRQRLLVGGLNRDNGEEGFEEVLRSSTSPTLVIHVSCPLCTLSRNLLTKSRET